MTPDQFLQNFPNNVKRITEQETPDSYVHKKTISVSFTSPIEYKGGLIYGIVILIAKQSNRINGICIKAVNHLSIVEELMRTKNFYGCSFIQCIANDEVSFGVEEIMLVIP